MKFLTIRGIFIDDTVNANGWKIREKDFPKLATDAIGKQIRVDHADMVNKVVGKITATSVHKPHGFLYKWDPANKHPHIMFEGELYITDEAILMPLFYRLVNSVSLGADANIVVCSVCGKPTRENGQPAKNCKCKGHEVLKDVTIKEISLVVSPAYDNTIFSIVE